MTIVYDPHQSIPGNLLVKKPQSIVAGKFRLIVPSDGPFFSDSVELFHTTTKLVEGRDYLLSHIYPTSILRTARRAHGAIWLINDKLASNITLTAHYLGHGKATPEQIAAERQANAVKIPSRCYWEDVIGVVYFPPVDIQFNRDDWKGEKEMMDALALLANKMSTPPATPNPFVNNIYFEANDSFPPPNFEYVGNGKFICKDDDAFGNSSRAYIAPTIPGRNMLRGKHKFSWSLKSTRAATSTSWAVFSTSLRQDNGPGFVMESSVSGQLELLLYWPGNIGWEVLHRSSFPKAQLANGLVATVDYDTAAGVYHFTMTSGETVFCDVKIDFTKPPSNIAGVVASTNIKAIMDVGVSASMSCQPRLNGEVTILELPGSSGVNLDSVYEMLVHWKDEIDAAFKNSPAIAHVKNTNNPHRDSWGWLRALQLNGLASDTALVDGRDFAQLAAAINAQLPTAAALANKLPRKTGAGSVKIDGTFTTHPGVTSITGSAGNGDSANVETATFFDPKAAMVLTKGAHKLTYTAPNGLRIRAGTNVFELLPNQSKATWNSKELLTPLTVGPHLPGGEAGGDGLFYGVSTPSVEITGNGIQGVPFVATWMPPDASVKAQYALRRLTDVFGYSDSLVATPALVKKLDALFRGKLLMNKASINGMHSLGQSVQMSKTTIALPKVSDVSDEDLPVSTAQDAELSKYVAADHIHDKSEFGIGNATTAKLGLIKFGGYVDDAGLALAGDNVLSMYKRVEELESTVSAAGVDVAVDIIRYGQVGKSVIPGQVTFVALMLTIKAQTYYLRKQYNVPLAAFNLAELFPSTASDGQFYIYVDMKDNAAFYFVTDKKVVETDTITEIGHVETSDGLIEFAEVRSVTRLGDFRELEEHAASVNEHIDYRPSARELLGNAPPPIVATNGLTPTPNDTMWKYDWRYGYDNIGVTTTTLTASAVLARGGSTDKAISLVFEFNGFSPDGNKVTIWDTDNMKFQYRIDTVAKRFELWLLGTFGSTSLPGTYIRSNLLPADYLSKPLRIGVFADANDGSVAHRSITIVCWSGADEVFRELFDETSANRPLNAPNANWNTIFNAAATVNMAMPINPRGKVVVVENSFEPARPLDMTSVKKVVDVPGVLGMVRGLSDWRPIDANGVQVPNLTFSADGQSIKCVPYPGNPSTHRILKQICPMRYDDGSATVLNTSILVVGGDNTIIEVVLGGFLDKLGKFHRFSMLLTNSNYITNPQGKLTMLGFAIDHATPQQVIIGAPAPLVSAAFNWYQIGKMPLVLNFTPGQVEATITILGLKYIIVFAYSPTAVTARFSPGAGNSSFSTITHDLMPFLPQVGVTAPELFDANASMWWGLGGGFDGQVTFEFDHSAGQSAMKGGGTKTLTSFSGYLEHLSGANAVRIFDEIIPDNEVSLTPNEIKLAFIKRHTELDLTGTLFAISPDAVRITLDIPNKRLQAVVFRL